MMAVDFSGSTVMLLCTKYDVLRVCTVYMSTSIYTTLGVVSTVYSEYSLLVIYAGSSVS
jgi:hypothetical protein